MRRKFKGIKKDTEAKDVDWRAYYEESKKAEPNPNPNPNLNLNPNPNPNPNPNSNPT
jgi:hypothetical protein